MMRYYSSQHLSLAPTEKEFMQEESQLAAVDLGSNSFRLEIAKYVGGHIEPLDSLRETTPFSAR